MRNKRGDVWWDFTAWIIIGVLILSLVLFGYLLATGKMEGFFEYIKYLFRFGK